MPFIGHCNCSVVRISLAEKPDSSIVCHCPNCKRAGGPFSVNFLLDLDVISVEDPTGSLKVYSDSNTKSGSTVERKFCTNCGSPIMSESPNIPGKAFLKASLFDEIPQPGGQVSTENQEQWVRVDVKQ